MPEVMEDNVIRIGFKLSDLKGKGTQYLVENGKVLAKFYNGSLIRSNIKSSEETTLVLA